MCLDYECMTFKSITEKIWKYRNYYLIFIFAFLILLFCSQCSFLYDFNDWCDVNCFMTMGRGIFQGKVPYRDLYEQKGPILYLLYGIGSLFSANSFHGFFMIEVALFTTFLIFAYKTSNLYVDKTISLFLTIPLGIGICISKAFKTGGSAEELMLPFIMCSLYLTLRDIKSGTNIISKTTLIASGICAAMVFWIKYTLLGFFLAFGLFDVIYTIKQKDYKSLGYVFLYFIGAMIVASLPVILYFGVNGALGDLWTAYFYNNIFLYQSTSPLIDRLTQLIYLWARESALYGLSYVLFLLFGIVFGFRKKNMESLLIISSLSLGYFFIYIGGRFYWYYVLPLSTYGIFGLIELALIIQAIAKRIKIKNQSLVQSIKYLFVAMACVSCYFACFTSTNYVENINRPREDYFQYRFGDQIAATGGTVLNYGDLDLGIYTGVGTSPSEKYFCYLNINLPESREAQQRAVDEGLVDYVFFASGSPITPTNLELHYELLDSVVQKYDSRVRTFYLYKKVR